MSAFIVGFWFAGIFVLYSYLGYPIVLKLLSFFKSARRPMNSPAGDLTVTLLISAYNEQAVIEEKILNSLSLNYPASLLEIIVVSDGSTDSTCEIVSRYANRGVKLVHYEGRIGKTACLNYAVLDAKGEIIVFSDGNSQYDKDAIQQLMKHFADPRIGFVTGRTIYLSAKLHGISEPIGWYSKIEQWTKALESKIGSCIGADGAIFAIRKALYQPLKSVDINDFVIPLNVMKQGYLGKLENGAFCFENITNTAHAEFERQVRISNRTIRAILNHVGLLNPFRFGLLSFQLFSHKAARLLIPCFMLILFLTNFVLAIHQPLYRPFFVGQLAFYSVAWFASTWDRLKGRTGLLSVPHTFCLVNLAIFCGWIEYFKGTSYVVWAPAER
jgi:cellulose synthase/poly-beta-1,6-N-acetylglucosamine synthase-like glycosyltransferase